MTTESTATTRRWSLPAWYEGNRVDNTKEGDISAGDQEMELIERARRIMKDDVGLTLPTLRGQDVPRNEKYDLKHDSQHCLLAGKSSSKICQDGTGTIAIASNNDNSNDRNANANSLVRGRPTAYVIDKMISSIPSHVRAVAERRPDLMSKLFSEREEPRRKSLTDVGGGGLALCVGGGNFASIGNGVDRPRECLSTAKEDEQW
jgi:hypothetical protein